MKRPSKGNLFKAIRGFCLECVGGSGNEVEKCTIPKCQLYDFRFGGNNPLFEKDSRMSELATKRKIWQKGAFTKTGQI